MLSYVDHLVLQVELKQPSRGWDLDFDYKRIGLVNIVLTNGDNYAINDTPHP